VRRGRARPSPRAPRRRRCLNRRGGAEHPAPRPISRELAAGGLTRPSEVLRIRGPPHLFERPGPRHPDRGPFRRRERPSGRAGHRQPENCGVADPRFRKETETRFFTPAGRARFRSFGLRAFRSRCRGRMSRSRMDRAKTAHAASALSTAPDSFSVSSAIWSSPMMKGGARSTWSPRCPSIVPPMG